MINQVWSAGFQIIDSSHILITQMLQHICSVWGINVKPRLFLNLQLKPATDVPKIIHTASTFLKHKV